MIQLLKFPKAKLELHMGVMDVLIDLANTESAFYKNMSSIMTELNSKLLKQFGVNINHMGLLQTILRECTSVTAVKDKKGIYRIVIPQGSVKVFPPEAASSQMFLSRLLKFIDHIHKSSPKHDTESPEGTRFWSEIKNVLINILQLPTNNCCYLYSIPLVILSNKLILSLSVSQNSEYDVSNTNMIINRLLFELKHLNSKDSLFYPEQIIPFLEHRQELCKSLMKLIESNISIGVSRPLGLNASEVDFDDFRFRQLPSFLRNAPEDLNILQYLRDRERSLRRRFREEFDDMRQRNLSDEDIVEPPQRDSVALSRRVVESQLIGLFAEIFESLCNGQKKLCLVYEPIAYSALMLISIVIGDIPTSVPNMISQGVIPNILKYIAKCSAPENDCLHVILFTLASFTLHEQGIDKVEKSALAEVIEKTFNMLILPGYDKCISKKKFATVINECADNILHIYSRSSHKIKFELTRSFKNLLLTLKKNGMAKIKKLAKEKEGELSKDLKESCKLYLNSVKNTMNIFEQIVERTATREHRKFLLCLNENNQLVKIVIDIERIEGIIKTFYESSDSVNDSAYGLVISKFYIKEFYRSITEPTECYIFTILIEASNNLVSVFGLNDTPKSSLEDFVTGKKKLGVCSDEIISEFPDSKKLKIVFGTIEWIAKSIRIFSCACPTKLDDLLNFITNIHLFIMREVIRLMSRNDLTKAEDLITVLKAATKDIKATSFSESSKRVSTFLLDKAKSKYERFVYTLYETINSALPNLVSNFISNKYKDLDLRTNLLDISQIVGKCAARLLEESFNKSLSDDPSATEATKALHTAFIIKDLTKLLVCACLSFSEVFEFCINFGFDHLHNIYQQLIFLIATMKPTPENTLVLTCYKFILTHIMKIYITIIDPLQLQLISSKAISAGFKTELNAQGFNSPDNFAASLFGYIIERLLETKYEHYNNVIRFLAECVPEAFKLLLESLEKYSKINLLTRIFTEPMQRSSLEALMEARARRDFRFNFPSSSNSRLITTDIVDRLSEEAYPEQDDREVLEEAVRRREEQLLSAQLAAKPKFGSSGSSSVVKTKIGMRTIDVKNIHREASIWFENILYYLYEGLYSVSTYKYKYLLYSLSQFQALNKDKRIRDGFALMLNQLQLLLFGIELNYEFNLIPNNDFFVSELAEPSVTHKLSKRIERYTKTEDGITEAELMVLYKMSAIIDVITTFLRLSKTDGLLKMMCENKIAQSLTVVLSKLIQKKMIRPGRKLLPKVLVLLGMIYKEVSKNFQSSVLEEHLKASVKEETQNKKLEMTELLPNTEDTKKLVELLCCLLDADNSPDKHCIVTTEILTAVLLLLTHLTKDYKNAAVVLESKVILKIFELEQVKKVRDSVPLGLFTKLVFNLFESPEILGNFMERIITSALFAKTQWQNKGMKIPENDREMAQLQKESAIDIDRFLTGMGILISRSSYTFFETCRRVTVLLKETGKDSSNKLVTKYMIALTKDCIIKLIKDNSMIIPPTKLMSQKDSTLTKTEYDYIILLQSALEDNQRVIHCTNPEILRQIVSRLMEVHFEAADSKYVISDVYLLDLLGQIIKIYPETLALLLSFPGGSVNGNNFISFLIVSLFPKHYLTKTNTLKQDNEWKDKVIALVRYMTFTNVHLHQLRHKIFMLEIRKRVIAELFRVLTRSVFNKEENDHNLLSQTYSCFLILEGLLISNKNSVVFPVANQYEMLKEVLMQKQELIRLAAKVINRIDFNSAEEEVLINSVINTLERVTRLNKMKSPKPDTSENAKEEATLPCTLKIYAEEYKLPGQIEIPIEELKEFGTELEDEYAEEKEIQVEQKISEAADETQAYSLRGSFPLYGAAMNDQSSDSDGDDSRDAFFGLMRLNSDRRMEERKQYSSVQQSNASEINPFEMPINEEPMDKGKVEEVKTGFSDIYKNEDVENTNLQILKIMKGDLLGEENHPPSEGLERRAELRQLSSHIDMRMRREGYRENELEPKEEEEDLPEISLFGDAVDKLKVSEALKNQLMRSLKIEVVEEESSLATEKNASESKKQKVMLPVELANMITSMAGINLPQHEEKKAEDNKEVHKEEERKEEKSEEGKAEESKSEVHKEEAKAVANISHILIAQRRNELAQLVPGFQVDNDEVVLQIDPEFLRELPVEMRRQSIESLLAQNRTAPSREPEPSEDLDPASFFATITDENLKDEILLTASPEFIAALPPDVISRAERLRSRTTFERDFFPIRRHREGTEEVKSRRLVLPNPLEPLLIVPIEEQKYGEQLVRASFGQTCRIDEESFEALIRLLYTNLKVKIPINGLFSNICCTKRHLYKLLNTMIFMLSKHQQYEKLFQTKSKSIELSKCVYETKIVDTYFPPVNLYKGIELNHLVYNIVSLRIISVMSSLLNKPQAANYFFKPIAEVRSENFMLKSICKLQKELPEANKETQTPLTELFLLMKNDVYKTSEKHLEAIIDFMSNLFNVSENLVSQKEEARRFTFTVSCDNVKQACQIFNSGEINDSTFNKLANILVKLSLIDENICVIVEELDELVKLTSTSAINEWNNEIFRLCIESEFISTSGIIKTTDLSKEAHIEIKLGRVLKLIKYLHDGHRILEEDNSGRDIRMYNVEGDAIEETLLQMNENLIYTEKSIKAKKVHQMLINILKKDILIDAFSVLTNLLTLVTKKTINESNSRKSQLLIQLMPSIEGIIMVYDYYFRDPSDNKALLAQIKEMRESKPENREELGKKYKRAYVFYTFLEKNHKAFNDLIRQMPQQTLQMMIKPFILRFPNLLDFENKRYYFGYEQKRIRGSYGMSTLKVNVARSNIFNESYMQLAAISLNNLKGRLRVAFKGEEATDVGGVTREWYVTLSRAMFNPSICLFKKSAHGNTYQPNPNSGIEKSHLNYFKFIGRIIGKALLDGQYLECYFTRSLYKSLVGQPLTIQDLQDYDSELYNSLLWMRDNDVTDLDCTFTYTADFFGKLEVKELEEHGSSKKVTNENKHLFILKMCKALLQDAIKEQIEALQKGLYDVIPKSLISIFDSKELELLISGLPDIDFLDLKKNTEYHGYSESSKVIQWMWELIKQFSTKERAAFLQFVTGTSKVPLDGFKNLPGSSGVQKFQIHKVYADFGHLPTAHTW